MKTRSAIAICLASAAIAGCATTGDYVDEVNDIQTRVIDASNSVGADVNASKKEIIKSLDKAQTEAKDAVSDLKDVDVPSDAEEGHAALIAGFEDLEKLYDNVRKEIESDSGSAAFEELRSKGTQIDKEIDKALDQINDELGLE